VFATPFALRIEGANFGSTTVYVHVSFTNYAVVQGATVYFIGMSSTGQTLTTTKTTDVNGDASAGIYGIMWDSTVEGQVRVVYAPSNYDQTKSVYGQSGSTTTLVVNDVSTPAYTLTVTSTIGGTTNPYGTSSRQGGELVYVTAYANSGYKFSKWVLNNVDAGTSNPIKLLMDKSYILNAEFITTGGEPPLPTSYTLSVTSTTGGTTSPSGSITYSIGEVVTVTANPQSDYTFSKWLLDGVDAGSSNPFRVTMDKSHVLHAVFSPAPMTYELTTVVKDQIGNDLQSATVDFVGKSTKLTDENGVAKESFESGSTVTVQASFTKQERTFQASKTITIDTTKTEAIVISRQFYWAFTIAYTDGTEPNGVLTLQGTTKNVTANVANGFAEAWLDNEVYSVYFHASPETKVGSLAPVNDGSASYTLTIPTSTTTSTTTTSSTTQSGTSASEPAPATPLFGEVKLSFLSLYIVVGVVVAVLLCVLAYALYSFIRGDDS